MKLRLNTFIFLLFAFVNTLIAQPPNATVATDCSQIQNAGLQIDANANTFSLDYTQSSGQYIVWDLHQETAAGDIVVNYGATDTQIAAEPLNSNPNDGEYYIKVWNVCQGDGSYDGAILISNELVVFPKIIAIEDDVVAYIGVPNDNPCALIDPKIITLCAPKNLEIVKYFVFGCDKNIPENKEACPHNPSKLCLKRDFEKFAIMFEQGILRNSTVVSTIDDDFYSDNYTPHLQLDDSTNDWFTSLVIEHMNTGIIPPCDDINLGGSKVQKSNNQYILSPNPTSGDLNVKFNLENTSNVDIQVYNLQSQMVKVLKSQQEVTKGSYSETFDVSSLQAGFYFLEIMTNEGKTVHKFMKN